MNPAPGWLRAAVLAAPQRFPFAVAATVLPEARLRGDSSLAAQTSEIVAGSASELVCTPLALGGAMSPLPAMLARELSEAEADGAVAGLVQTIEHCLHDLLRDGLLRRAVDDPVGHQRLLEVLGAVPHPGAAARAGRLVDGPTADAVAVRVAAAAGCQVRVVPLAGGTLPLAPGMGAELGRARLGRDAALGESMQARELGVRLELGPVPSAAAERLRPGGELYTCVVETVRRALPDGLAWRLELVVLTIDAPRAGLGSARLGASLRLAGAARPDERELLATG